MRGGWRVADDSDWRSEHAYDYVDQLTPTDLAWEFLRRNPEYQRAYRAIRTRARVTLEAETALAEQWGLRSPGRPPPLRQTSTDILVRPRQSRRDRSHTRFYAKRTSADER